jgi:hypothetical protein
VRSLSTSEAAVPAPGEPPSLQVLVDEVRTAVAAALAEETGPAVGGADAARLLVSAVRLYASQSDGGRRGPSGAELAVTPTEAVTVAAALLRSQQLTPFEFAIWFSEQGHAAGMEAED